MVVVCVRVWTLLVTWRAEKLYFIFRWLKISASLSGRLALYEVDFFYLNRSFPPPINLPVVRN